MMHVDIIIPAYNPGPYLRDALSSCTNQSYDKFKITVIDDCSKEDVEKLVKQFPEVSYLKTPKNGGPGYARNYGISKTNGDLISFLDADDIMHQDKLFHSVEAFRKRPKIGMTCGNYRIFANRQRLLRPFYRRSPTITWTTLMRTNLVASGSVTLRRDVFEEVGGFREDIMIAEDYDCWIRVAELYDILYINRILYYYTHINKEGSSLMNTSKYQKKHNEIVKDIKNSSAERVCAQTKK